jgi:hypothetical protein
MFAMFAPVVVVLAFALCVANDSRKARWHA